MRPAPGATTLTGISRLPTRTGLLLAVAGAIVALPTVASGALPSGASAPAGPAAPAANSVTFQDSTGENPAAPDITTIVVSNDDAGRIQFRINIPNRPTLAQDMLIGLNVDTDNNQQTGDEDGADYAVEAFGGEVALFRWDGETFTRRPGDPPFTSLLLSYQGGATITISRAELGNTTRFRFSAVVIAGITVDDTTTPPSLNFDTAVADFAPAVGAGLYSYQVLVARPTLVVRNVTRAPARPAAGRPFTLRLRAARSDTGAVIQNGRVTCQGRAGNARLRAVTARVQGGQVTCTWRIPANAKGRTFRGTATVVFEGLRASRSFSARIR